MLLLLAQLLGAADQRWHEQPVLLCCEQPPHPPSIELQPPPDPHLTGP